MLRRVRKGHLGLPLECGLSASPETTEQERGKREERKGRGVKTSSAPSFRGKEGKSKGGEGGERGKTKGGIGGRIGGKVRVHRGVCGGFLMGRT